MTGHLEGCHSDACSNWVPAVGAAVLSTPNREHHLDVGDCRRRSLLQLETTMSDVGGADEGLSRGSPTA